MNKKLVKEFLFITFSIMLVFWGGCALLSQETGLTVNHWLLRIMHSIGGFSPTIASFVSLKRAGKVKSFKEWLKKIFDLKHSAFAYSLMAFFVLLYYGIGCAVNGFEIGAPVFMALVLVPMMLVGGGNEEVGWRMILQPELEKKFGFNLATVFTAVIWWLWHLPIFFIRGTVNADTNYFFFGIMCLTLSYAMAAVRRVSNGVFPCVLLHCLINGLSAVFVFKLSLMGCLVTLLATVAAVWVVMLIPRGANKIDTATPVFKTQNIKSITLFWLPVNSDGIKVPSEHMADITAWIGTFTVGEKIKGAPCGINMISFRIEYSDGTVAVNGIDTITLNGVVYSLRKGQKPKCFNALFALNRSAE